MSFSKNDIIRLKTNSEPATIEHLIVFLVASDECVYDKSYLFSFFLSARLFVSSHELLLMIFDKTIEYMLVYDDLTDLFVHRCLARFVYVLEEWSKYFPYDFRDLNMVQAFSEIQEKCISIDETFCVHFNRIAAHLAMEIRNLELYEVYLKKLHAETKRKLHKDITRQTILDFAISPSLFAKQLTLIELDRLSHIGPDEFINYFFISSSQTKAATTSSSSSAIEQHPQVSLTRTGGTAASTSTAYIDENNNNNINNDERMNLYNKLTSSTIGKQLARQKSFSTYLQELKASAINNHIYIKRARQQQQQRGTAASSSSLPNKTASNIEAYIVWFNRLSSLVVTEIVKNLSREARVQLVRFFIDTAHQCVALGNYNSAMAILAGLDSFHVARLKKTWSKALFLPCMKQKWQNLVKHMDSTNNFQVYREILRKKAGTSAHENSKNSVILIPIFSLVLKDLTFLYSGAQDMSMPAFTNLSKFWQMGKYISENILYKNYNLSIAHKVDIINYLLTDPLLSDEACAYSSFKCEPPVNTNELNYFKKLRRKFFNE